MQKNIKKAVFISKNQLGETLATTVAPGKRLLEPFKSFSSTNGLPFNSLEDCQVENDAEVHWHEADLWLCLEGEVTFICDGEMDNPSYRILPDGSEDQREIKAKFIRGGATYILHSGDWLWIPAGVPHQHTCSGSARLMIIKIPDNKE